MVERRTDGALTCRPTEMCTLYSLTTPPGAMRDLFLVPEHHDLLGNHEPLPSIFPGAAAPIVRISEYGGRELVRGRFGFLLPQISKRTGKPILPKSVANARQDRVESSPFWRQSFFERRCLVPASGFCEMKGRQPATYFWFGVSGESGQVLPFAFAGLWKPFSGILRGERQSFLTHSIVTTTPNDLVAKVHPSRMPVILDPGSYDTWLTGSPHEACRLLRPYPAAGMRVLASGEGIKSLHQSSEYGSR